MHFTKKSFDFDYPLHNDNPKDDTFKRLIGDKNYLIPYRTFNSTYGNHEHPEKKYMHPFVREKDQKEKFEKYVYETRQSKQEIEDINKSLHIFDTTNKNLHVEQPPEQNLGHRHMYNQNYVEIPQTRPDKLFMAQHKMSKFPTVISNSQANQYVDKYVPYYKDKEITVWSSNLDKGNMYRSHCLGINSFGRSHAFTQPIQRSKGIKQFYGNTLNSTESKNIYMNDHDVNYYDTYKAECEKLQIIPDLIPQIKDKVLRLCSKKGWIGLRKLKIYLRDITKGKKDQIDKADLKYNIAKLGLQLDDNEINYLFDKFDTLKNNHINFIQVFNVFKTISPERKKQINNFMQQVKVPGASYISFELLERMANMNYHPEVTRFQKPAPDVEKEYLVSWDNLKEDNFITEENFLHFFEDISSCVESDEDFLQILHSLGYK